VSRRKNEDMEAFQVWLIDVQCLADSTACVYASTVRATLPWVDDLEDEDKITASFTAMGKELSRRALTSRRSAWKRFIGFAETRGVTLAMPRAAADERGPPALPHEARAALHYLSQAGRFLQKHVARLTWDLFDTEIPTSQVFQMRDPTKPGEVLDIPREHVEALRAWAGWDVGDKMPLIPWRTSSTIPYTTSGYRRELRIYRKSIGWANEYTTSTEVDRAALAETEAILAARRGVKVHGQNAPDPDFVPTRSTQELRALIEGGSLPSLIPTLGTKQAQEDGPDRGAPGPAEDKAVEASPAPRDREPTPVVLSAPVSAGFIEPELSPPAVPDAGGCLICGYPREVHAEAFGLTDGTISNCAVENGFPEDTCQMCEKGCYGRHGFKAGV